MTRLPFELLFFQLREEFDRGVDVSLEEEHSVHDVAALLKEFLRDMPDPLLTRELYTAFINTLCEYGRHWQECVRGLPGCQLSRPHTCACVSQ